MQRNRFGEVPEALPGSTLERGIYEKKRQELERSSRLLDRGRASQQNEGLSDGWEEVRSAQKYSEDGRAVYRGEGADRSTQPAQETWAG